MKTNNVEILNGSLGTFKAESRQELDYIAKDIMERYGVSSKASWWMLAKALQSVVVDDAIAEQTEYYIENEL